MTNANYLFRRSPFERLADCQKTRTPWICLFLFALIVLGLSHGFFERWLLMPPCEQCVYIRFAFFMTAVGAFLAIVRPQALLSRVLAYLVLILSALYGIVHAVTLIGIHWALRSGDPSALFGIKGCSLSPNYPFGLPMADFMPWLFQPTGPCGVDLPVVPPGTALGEWQSFLIEQIREAGSWYLIPPLKTGSMAECALLIFILMLAAYIVMIVAGLRARKAMR